VRSTRWLGCLAQLKVPGGFLQARDEGPLDRVGGLDRLDAIAHGLPTSIDLGPLRAIVALEFRPGMSDLASLRDPLSDS